MTVIYHRAVSHFFKQNGLLMTVFRQRSKPNLIELIGLPEIHSKDEYGSTYNNEVVR